MAGLLNQGAINRLCAAGVSVPGLDIGGRNNTANVATTSQQSPHSTAANVSELQSRFAALHSAAGVGLTEDIDGHMGHGAKPVLPPKRIGLASPTTANYENLETNNKPAPPPVPLGTKPR